MSAHVPPTEAELDWLCSYAATQDIPALARTCAEIRRLRALLETVLYERDEEIERLRTASEGK